MTLPIVRKADIIVQILSRAPRKSYPLLSHCNTVLAILVDDIAIESNCRSLIEALKSHFASEFKFKLLGQILSLISWKITRT